jgi:hypothetical protein
MQFGIALPTCIDGAAYPIRFADDEGILPAAQPHRIGVWPQVRSLGCAADRAWVLCPANLGSSRSGWLS